MKDSSKGGISSKRISSFLALLSFTAYMPISSLPAFADISATALPVLDKAVNGDIATTGNKMDVSVVGEKGTVGQFDWKTFNVGKDSTVNWVFNANNQTALNRVLASGGMSYIYGKLTESSGNGCASCTNTSKVILINPSGVLFGNGSSVNLNSFTASTFDIQGAKNLSSLSDADLKAYAGTGGTTGGLFNIAGYNKTVTFVPNDNMVNGNGYIKTDGTGTRLASIATDGANIYANKSLAMVGNKIDITNNTSLKTTYSNTPNTDSYRQTRSNIKLVTGDGVNFYYTSAGNIDNNKISTTAATKSTDNDYGINITDSAVRSGHILMYNGVDKAGKSNINISNSKVYSKKLLGTDYVDSNGASHYAELTGTNGNITIQSNGKVNIDNSDIQTTNASTDSQNIGYGNLVISGKEDVTVKNTQLRTADSLKNTSSSSIQAGNISIASTGGNVNLVQDTPNTNPNYSMTAVVASGNLTASAANNLNITGYDKIQASKDPNVSSAADRTVTLKGTNVTADNTYITASNINAGGTSANSVNIKDSRVSGDNVNLYANNTTIDNSLMQYNNLNFYKDASSTLNNVTIKNASTFNDKDDTNLTISTNGNLTLDNATLKKRVNGSTTSTNQSGVTLESTTGNVTVQNGSYVAPTGDITVNAKAGAIAVSGNSTLNSNGGSINATAKNNIAISGTRDASGNTTNIWAGNGGNVNLTSTNGKITVNNSNVAAEGGNTTLSQLADMNVDTDFAGAYIGATDKLTISSEGNITAGKLAAGTGHIGNYTDLLSLNNDDLNIHFVYSGALSGPGASFNAGKNITISDLLSAQKVGFDATNIDLASTANMTLADVTVDASNVTNIGATGDLLTNGLEIVNGVKTTLSGNTVKTKGDSVISTNGNKLAVNANGAVDIGVTGVTNADKGLEINADVNTSNGSAPLAGKTVKVNAKDGTLAISKIKADTLDITANNLIAGKTTISASTDNVSKLAENGVDMSSKGYIEIKTDGGFNLDNTTSYEGKDNIYTGGNYNKVVTNQYTANENTSSVTDHQWVVTGTEGEKVIATEDVIDRNNVVNTDVKETVTDVQTETKLTENVEKDGVVGYTTTTTTTTTYDKTTTVTYGSKVKETYTTAQTTESEQANTTTTKTWDDVTESREDQHIATLGNQTNDFVLVYGKTKTDKTAQKEVTSTGWQNTGATRTEGGQEYTRLTDKTGTKTFSESNTETNLTRISVDEKWYPCEVEDPVEPDVEEVAASYDGNDIAAMVKNPRRSEGISNAAPIQNDLADTSSTVVAAAARIQLDDEANENSDSDDDLLNTED